MVATTGKFEEIFWDISEKVFLCFDFVGIFLTVSDLLAGVRVRGQGDWKV